MKNLRLFERMGKTLGLGISLLLLLAGCQGLFEPDTGSGGNVTVTVETGEAARTIRPNDVTAFERIELEFANANGAVKILILDKGQTSGTTTLEAGTWSITARGYIPIGDSEYEAAWGSSSVTVASGNVTVTVPLQTGIFDGKPGVFSYTVSFPETPVKADLEITPLNDLYGYEISNTGKSADLVSQQAGSFALSPGYYLVSLSAKISGEKMAIWNELVHIYSGQETALTRTFAADDFTGSVTLSGYVYGGELEGRHIEKATVVAYADANNLNRIASVEVPSLSKMTVAPYYYSGAWSITVPESLVGKDLYFPVEETLGGPDGTSTYFWGGYAVEVSANGNTDIALNASFTWGKWVNTGNDEGLTYSIGPDGTVTATTTETSEWFWYHGLWIDLPLENDLRYAYEFEAWTESGERSLVFQYIDDPEHDLWINKTIYINEEPAAFTIISDRRIEPTFHRNVTFQVSHPEVTGTLYIKLKSVKHVWDYVPLAPEGGGSRFTATPEQAGIRLKADLRGLPEELVGLQFHNETSGGFFDIYFDYDNRIVPDIYEFIYPYVEAGKEYTFTLKLQDISLIDPPVTVTAIGGRGELCFSNFSELALVREGNIVRFNQTPLLSNFDDVNIENAWYNYAIVTGTSWADPAAIWRYAVEADTPIVLDLLDFENIPSWVDNFSFIDKTCFVYAHYAFEYTNSDIYPTGSLPGTFFTEDTLTAPFTYPNVISGTFTAVPHEEGVQFIIDIAKIPPRTTWLTFWPADHNNLYHNVDSWEWKDEWGEFYGKDKIEIIYPFVEAGRTYTFFVHCDGVGTGEYATVTAAGGLGEMWITNSGEIGLLYNSATKTMSFNETPIVPSINSPKITKIEYEWQFYQGHNWNDSQWRGRKRIDSPQTSMVFDDALTLDWGDPRPSGTVFVNYNFKIQYDGGRWFTTDNFISPSFTFPPYEFPVIFMRANHWWGEDGPGSNWDSGNVFIRDYYAETIKSNATYEITLTGNSDTPMDQVGLFLHAPIGSDGNWIYISDFGGHHQIPTGNFSVTLEAKTKDFDSLGVDPNDLNIEGAYFSFWNGTLTDAASGTIMATITNFGVTIEEK